MRVFKGEPLFTSLRYIITKPLESEESAEECACYLNRDNIPYAIKQVKGDWYVYRNFKPIRERHEQFKNANVLSADQVIERKN